MKREIKSISINFCDIKYVFGFGSFFRNEIQFSDIDILVVIRDCTEDGLDVFYRFRDHLPKLRRCYGIYYDLLIFTEKEFSFGPLRDMNSLVSIYEAE